MLAFHGRFFTAEFVVREQQLEVKMIIILSCDLNRHVVCDIGAANHHFDRRTFFN
jgi:hypothetical protein